MCPSTSKPTGISSTTTRSGGLARELVDAMTDTMHGQRADSPVFLSLPSLAEQDRSRFSPVPRGFAEEVEHAAAAKDISYLGLLAAEAAGFTWEVEGWRTVGKKLFDLGAWPTALRTLERIGTSTRRPAVKPMARHRLPADGEPNGVGPGHPRALQNPGASRRHLSEAWALRGSNEKTQWVRSWSALEPSARSDAALRSPFLLAAFQSYEKAFSQELNSFYPGLVALSLLTIRRI